MELSLPGVVGAVFGVAVGVIDYGIVASVIRRAVEKKTTRFSPVVRAGTNRVEWVLKVVFVVNAMVFAGLGYWLGKSIGG